MKLILALLGVLLGLCSSAAAQESGSQRVVVPARNSTRPRKLDVQMVRGSVTIKTHSGKDVIVETGRGAAPAVNGMHRIEPGQRGLSIEEEDNVITVRAGLMKSGDLMISVPADTSVTAKTSSGTIEIDGLRGEFDVTSHNGRVTLNNVSGSVLAHSLNGPIKVSLDRVDPGKPLSFSTLNGPIEVVLPADIKANVKVSTHGEIWTDFDVRLGGGTITQPNNTGDGKFRVTIDRNVIGTINGGGQEAIFHTLNGKITIKKK